MDKAAPPEYRSALTNDEQRRADAFRFNDDRHRWITARYALRSILGAYLDMDPADVRLRLTPQGKPELEGTSTLHFNLSHSRRCAVIAVAAWPLGIDVETKDRAGHFTDLAKRFFAPAEVHTLLRLPTDQQPHAFLQLWTRKEAYIKARGLGFSLPLSAFTVTLRDASSVECDAAWEDSKTWYCHKVETYTDHIATLVCPHRVVALNSVSWCPPCD